MGRYARRDGVFGVFVNADKLPIYMSQCQVLAMRARFNPSEIWQDGAYFSERFVEYCGLVYGAGGEPALYQFRICVYNNISFVDGQYTMSAAARVNLGDRLAALALRGKASAPTPIAATSATTSANVTAAQAVVSTVPRILSTNFPLARSQSVVIRSGVGTKPVPPEVVPMPKGPLSVPTASNEVSLVEKTSNGYTYVACSDIDALGILATLSIPSGPKVTGAKDFSGAHWSVINNDVTTESSEPAALLSGIIGNGDGVVMTADADSVYITATKFVDIAANLAPSGQSEIFVLRDPAAGWLVSAGPGTVPAATSDGTPPSNTGMYIAVGVGIVAAGGLIAYLATRKK